MPTDQVRRFANTTALQARDLGASAPSRPFGYLTDSDVLKYEDEGGTVRELVTLDNTQTLSNKTISGGAGALFSKEVTFTETAGAGVYTGSVDVPAGATIVDVIVHAVALWDNAGNATMIVGDVADDNGFFTGVDLKATDLLAAESISFAKAGGKEGADVTATQVNRRYLATARVVSGIITTTGAGGSTGRTRMTVIYSSPVSTDITAATKV